MKLLTMRKIAASVGIVILCVAGTANATVTFNSMSGTPNDAGTFSSPNSLIFGGSAAPSSNVSDFLSFTISNLSSGSVFSSSSVIGDIGFSSFSTSLWNTADTTGTMLAGASGNFVGGNWASSWSYSPLAANGTYFIHIDGATMASFLPATYSGNLTVAAIPEPEVYAMLVAGLGLMGFVAGRRK